MNAQRETYNIDNLIKQVSLELMKCHENESFLVFPEYHNDSKELIRISEQESKIVFSKILFDNKIRFAIEVPTKSKHTQKGVTPASARFDLVIYREAYNFEWVIELKAKNPPIEHFRKDFEKMILSDSDCLWFHTLKNAEERTDTFGKLFGKFNEALNIVLKQNDVVQNLENTKYSWKFAIIVLEKRKLYIRDLKIINGKFDKFQSIDQFKEEEL